MRAAQVGGIHWVGAAVGPGQPHPQPHPLTTGPEGFIVGREPPSPANPHPREKGGSRGLVALFV